MWSYQTSERDIENGKQYTSLHIRNLSNGAQLKNLIRRQKVLTAYFNEKSKTIKSSTIWSLYSELKAMIFLKSNVDRVFETKMYWSQIKTIRNFWSPVWRMKKFLMYFNQLIRITKCQRKTHRNINFSAFLWNCTETGLSNVMSFESLLKSLSSEVFPLCCKIIARFNQKY